MVTKDDDEDEQEQSCACDGDMTNNKMRQTQTVWLNVIKLMLSAGTCSLCNLEQGRITSLNLLIRWLTCQIW